MFVNVLGAPGSGTSSLASALAQASTGIYFDADMFLWAEEPAAYKTKRPNDERNLLLENALSVTDKHVYIAGSVCGWREDLEDYFDVIVFLVVPTRIRLRRLRSRELARFERVDPDFMRWAASYDSGDRPGRNRQRHEQWLAQRKCPIIRIEGCPSIAESLAIVLRNPQVVNMLG